MTYENVTVLTDGIRRHESGALVITIYKGDITDLIVPTSDRCRLIKNATVTITDSDDSNTLITITASFTPPCSETTIKHTIQATNYVLQVFEIE